MNRKRAVTIPEIQEGGRRTKRQEDGSMRQWLIRLLFFALTFSMLTGCRIVDVSKGEIRDVEYTVPGSDDLPEEVKETVEKQGEEPFSLAYESGGFLYLMKGYGKQKSGGYSIRVERLYTVGQTIHVKTELEGPETKEEQKGGESCPVIVLKLEARKDASVVFEG